MSTASWMQAIEPSRTTSANKYEDVMAEFRANGRDSDTSSLAGSRAISTSQGCLATPSTQAVPASQPAQPTPTPCSLCGICPPIAIPGASDFTSKDVGGSVSASPSSSSPSLNPLNSQFNNMDIVDLQQQFGAGLRKLLVDKPGLRQEWPFVRRDYSPISPPPTNGVDNIWQLNSGQYPRTNNITAPIGGINYQLQRLQQLRQKKAGFMVDGFQECVFCRNNGEQVNFYRSHELKDQLGRVVCPVLRAFTCPCCGATGDNAHTIKYCPEKGSDFVSGIGHLRALRVPSGKRRIGLSPRVIDNQKMDIWFNEE